MKLMVRFLNSFIESSPTDREKVHIQSELEEAGLDMGPLKKLLSQVTVYSITVLEEAGLDMAPLKKLLSQVTVYSTTRGVGDGHGPTQEAPLTGNGSLLICRINRHK